MKQDKPNKGKPMRVNAVTHKKTGFKISLILTLLFMITGCPTKPVKPPQPPLYSVAKARILAINGLYQQAAAHYQTLANTQLPPLQQIYLLEAVNNYIAANLIPQAKQLLNSIITSQIDKKFQRQKILYHAQIALIQNRPERTLEILANPFSKEIPIPLHLKYYRLRAKAYRLAGKPIESATELMYLDRLLELPDDKLINQKNLLSSLNTLTDTSLQVLQLPAPDIFSGWLELARVLKFSNLNPEEMRLRLYEWKKAFIDHPAIASGLIETYLGSDAAPFLAQIKKIGILLPATGRWSKIANVIKNGIVAAHFQNQSAQKPELAFYYSQSTEEALKLYDRAANEGADIVIGPLNKQAIDLLAKSGGLRIPVLSLNHVAEEITPPQGFYQFALSSEEEARLAAERIWLDDHSKVIALLPQNNWGERIGNAFHAHWNALGGTLLETQFYSPKKNDFSQSIRRLLNLDESKYRFKKIKQLLNEDIKFEPRRRQDIDSIFIAAQPRQARIIGPQLLFHQAMDIPAYTTSHIFSGQLDKQKDQDLQDFIFCDIPWILTDEANENISLARLLDLWPNTPTHYMRFFALGIDAYNLLSQLEALHNDSKKMFDGKTGSLFVDANYKVHRQLVWARFNKGRPQIIGYAPRIELPEEQITTDETTHTTPNNPTDDLTLNQTTTPNPDESTIPNPPLITNNE